MSFNYLVICAIFKNETWGMREWIEHHKHHGVDHIYLVNDDSDDDYMSILQPYINMGYVTLFQNEIKERYTGRQIDINNKYFIPLSSQARWIANIDLDEYLYSPKDLDIKNILKNYEDYGVVQVNWTWMSSNGHIKQPAGIVKSFTKRCNYNVNVSFDVAGRGMTNVWLGGHKCIANTKFDITSYFIHRITSSGNLQNASVESNPEDPDLLINHYQLQSREYWEKVKMKRGDVNFWFNGSDRLFTEFDAMDVGDIDDFRLRDQNETLDLSGSNG